MLSLASAESILTIVLLIAAYYFSVIINDIIQALVNNRMGDDTAVNRGYTSLNPVHHFDIISFIALLIFRVGWSRMVPVTFYKVRKDNFIARLLLIFAMEPIVSLAICLVSLIILKHLISVDLIENLLDLLFMRSGFTFSVISSMGHISSAKLLVAMFLTALVFLNLVITAMAIIFNGFRFFIIALRKYLQPFMSYIDLILLLGPIALFYCFNTQIINFFLNVFINLINYI